MLNPEKCVFGVEAGKFLGFLLTERGIEANLDKWATITGMRSPAIVKEVQQLNGCRAALSRFLLVGGDKEYPYFQCLKKKNRFTWTHECEDAFLKLNEYLASPSILCKSLLGIPQRPIYFVSKVLQGSEVRYQAIEKEALAVVFAAWRMRPYFQSLTMILMTDLPIRKVLQKLDITGRMVCWAIELSEFDVQYEPRGHIKGRVYADFVVKLSSEATRVDSGDFQWVLSVDGSSNQQGNGAGIILEGPNKLLIDQALRFTFKANNKQAEYETLVAGMVLAKELGARSLLVKSDSLLVTGQATGEY